MTPPAALAMCDLTKVYPTASGPFVVMRDFSLSLAEGEFVCLVGHSGCGKSTVLSIAAGLGKATNGRVLINGAPIDGPGLDRGVVFQAPCLLPWLSVQDNVRLAIDQAKPRLPKRERAGLAAHYLERVGLGDALQRRPSEISAGMQQRVGIARAFALAPRVMLLDEPFGMLDSITRLELQEVLLELWAAERTTTLMVTHDVDEALFVADRIALMTNGPEARLHATLRVPFARPRSRRDVMEHPLFYELREQIMTFFEEHAGGRSQEATTLQPAAALA
jgi:nitrate/nitrite transport system ATP-binding protein